MLTGTFYGNRVRIDTKTDKDVTYYVRVLEDDNMWTTVAEYSEAQDPFCRDEAITLAKRLKARIDEHEN